jgi:hypothetical protein
LPAQPDQLGQGVAAKIFHERAIQEEADPSSLASPSPDDADQLASGLSIDVTR